jgi:hypothetical protein
MENISTPIQINRFSLPKKLLKMLQASVAIEPILVNLVAIILGMGLVILLNHPNLFPKLGKWHHFFINTTYGLILLQTIKSATRSLFIPVVVLCIAGVGIGLLNFIPICHWISLDFCKKLILLGVIGMGTSIFVMK